MKKITLEVTIDEEKCEIVSVLKDGEEVEFDEDDELYPVYENSNAPDVHGGDKGKFEVYLQST
jgi:hypothetical protein